MMAELEGKLTNKEIEEAIAIHEPVIFDSLDDYLTYWDFSYKKEAEDIKLFNKELTLQWSKQQRQHFIKIFYHSRGHFADFLWHLGNYAPDKFSKDIILENIAEEFNGHAPSHEFLYLDFATKEGVFLDKENRENRYYICEMKNFNEVHLDWLYSHPNWDSKISAFSAYERLDSTDYELLSDALFINEELEHPFFRIHRKALHFDKTYISLLQAWENNANLVKEAFDFIASTQIDMWRKLSDEVFSISTNK